MREGFSLNSAPARKGNALCLTPLRNPNGVGKTTLLVGINVIYEILGLNILALLWYYRVIFG